MNKTKAIIMLLCALGHDIKYREHTTPNGQHRLYIEEIDGDKYKIAEQSKAREHLMELVEWCSS